MFAYIDESGDTGISKKSSKYFILTAFLISENESERLENDIKKYLRRLIKVKKSRIHYFHAYKESNKTKLDLLKIINRYDYKIVVRVTKKSKVVSYEKEIINMLNLFDSSISKVFVSRYETRKNVIDSIKSVKEKGSVSIEANSKNLLLQVADLFSWIVFNKYEFDKTDYFSHIKTLEKQNL